MIINGDTKIISLESATLDVTALWSFYMDWLALSDNSKFPSAMRSVGGDDIDTAAGTRVPAYIYLINGWRIRPMESQHTLNVGNGILLVDGGGDPFVNTIGTFMIRINYSQPVQAITVSTGGGSGASAASIAEAVWVANTIDNNVPGTMGEKLNSAGAAGDPWNVSIPSAYPEGTAGYKLGNLSTAVSSSSAISTVVSGFVLTTGTETNSYTDTASKNNIKHSIIGVGNLIDCYYTFNVGLSGVPVSLSLEANLQNSNDTLSIFGWDFSLSQWHQVGILNGTGSSSTSSYEFTMLSSLVGAGANSGEVRVRFSGGSSSPVLDIDFLHLNYAVIPKTTSFEGLAQGGTSNTLIFPFNAESVDDYYFPSLVVITAGTGIGQSRRIDSYTGATRTATVATPWAIIPDSTSIFNTLPWGSVRVSSIDTGAIDVIAAASAVAVWDELTTTHSISGSYGEKMDKLLTLSKFLALK